MKSMVCCLALSPAVLLAAASFDVRSFGAVGDGVTKDTFAIQKAIDAAHAAGGGEVLVPAGTFLSGTLYLKSHVDFHLGVGAVLKASSDRADYNASEAFPQNGVCLRECSWGAHFILCIEQEDVTLRGPGKIDGNSSAFLVDPKTGRAWKQPKAGYDPTPSATGGQAIPWRPSQMIEFVESRNIRVTDLEIADAPYWSLFIWGCEQVGVRGCWIHNERDRYYTHNGDGIDIDSSRHVTVSDCRIRVCDDAITLRASGARLKSAGDCAYVTIANCSLSSLCNAVRVGVGEGRIHDALMDNIAVYDTRSALSFVSSWDPQSTKGVDMQRLKFSNWTLSNVHGQLVKMTAGHMAKGVVRKARMRDITFDNFTGTALRRSLVQGCSADQPVENVVFRNIDVSGLLVQEHVKNVRYENCAFKVMAPPKPLNIVDFGAKTDNTPAANAAAIQKAIDRANAEGGGTVVVPAGTFVSGTLYLKSYVNLKLEKDAVLKASDNLADYNKPDAYPENWGCVKEYWNACHFIIGYEVSEVRITGPGTIDGHASAFFDEKPMFYGKSCWREGICVAKDKKNLRPGQMIVFIRGNDLVVSDVTIRNSPCWSLYFAGSHRVRVRNYTVRNGRKHGNTDGVDIECCSDVILENLDVDTGDDGIAIRGQRKHGARDKACENITVRNCRLRVQADGIRFGVGDGEIRDVTVENVKVETAGWVLGFQSFYGKPDGQGVDMEDITIRNLRAEKGCYGSYEVISGGAAQKYGIRNIRLENCTFDTEKPSRFEEKGAFKSDVREGDMPPFAAPLPKELTSSVYRVKVDGVPIDVLGVPAATMHDRQLPDDAVQPYYAAFFAADREVTVSVSSDRDLSKARLLPTGLGIVPKTRNRGEVTFRAKPPFVLSVEPTVRHRALILSAKVPERNPPSPKAAGVHYFAAGRHHPEKIVLKSNETLYLAEGAVVEGGVVAIGDNIRVCGRGILSGIPWAWAKGPTGGHFFKVRGNNNVVEDITILGSPNWTVVLDGCTNTLVRGVNILNGRVLNDDGIDVCRSRDTTIRDCFIRSQDDCITPKYWCEGLKVENCSLWTDVANIFRIGYECAGPQHAFCDFAVKGVNVIHQSVHKPPAGALWSENAVYIQASNGMRFGNMVFEDFRFDAPEKGDNFACLRTQRTNDQWQQHKVAGDIDGVTFRNIRFPIGLPDGSESIWIENIDPARKVTNVRFANFDKPLKMTERGKLGAIATDWPRK